MDDKNKSKNKKDEFMAMARKMGISIKEMREMLGLTNVDKEGIRKHRKGGMMVKKKMRGGGMMKVAKKKMRGGGMMKVAKKKMMRGGVAKKKK